MDDKAPKRSKTAGPRHGIAVSRTLRRDETNAEHLIWLSVRDRRLDGFKFRRQQAIGPYVVDFVCQEARVIVELDGGQHMANTKRDAVRTSYLAECGYRVLRFWNNDALGNTSGVLEEILRNLRTPHPNPLPQGERE